MDRVIEAKIAAIIDDTTLVLNAGSERGVQQGMTFVVFAEHSDIKDPDTGESLGHWEMVKAKVVVIHVQERLCTVRAPVRDERLKVGGTRTLSAMMVEHSVGSTTADPWQRLDVRAADIAGKPQTQPIAVGDRARLVIGTEDGMDNVADASAAVSAATDAADGPQ